MGQGGVAQDACLLMRGERDEPELRRSANGPQFEHG
jgi:hypothetical protein